MKWLKFRVLHGPDGSVHWGCCFLGSFKHPRCTEESSYTCPFFSILVLLQGHTPWKSVPLISYLLPKVTTRALPRLESDRSFFWVLVLVEQVKRAKRTRLGPHLWSVGRSPGDPLVVFEIVPRYVSRLGLWIDWFRSKLAEQWWCQKESRKTALVWTVPVLA